MKTNNTLRTNNTNTNSIFNNVGTSGTTLIDTWNLPERVQVNEVGEAIEMIYTQTSRCSRLGGLPPYHDERVFKIVYSCVDGKWNKPEPIYGKTIPAQDTYYEF